MPRFLFPLIAALMLWTTPAQAEITQCTNITTLPTVISTQGVYCLKQDLATNMTSGNAITINANNVTLDCNDWKIGGLAAGVNTDTVGISSARLNTTIRNCGIRGFRQGIHLEGGGGYLVEDNRFDHNTEMGMLISGDSSIIRRNRIMDTGGRPLSRSTAALRVWRATATLIADNLIANISVTGDENGNGHSYAIATGGSERLEIARNTMVNIAPAGAGSAFATVGSSGWEVAILRDNTALNPAGTNGAAFDGGAHASLCMGNTSIGYASAITWCTDAGGNSNSPGN